ncbi:MULTISPECIES: Crp/Fnr family transcriptional regulator [Streptomyces]|uniref:Crp/Fnr family transcriptional regulator n=1 Tax=Streptomyces TaxID=1883 RepID=UPI00292F56D1|nr:Crp/Fnr family transcriptional regulator [Streptomyces sp. NEAU-HV9]
MTSTAARTGPAPRPVEDRWPEASLLGGLRVETRNQLIGLGRPVRFEGGERLLREGEYGSHVFLLLSGWFKVLATTDDGREALMAVRAGGDIVGELACFDAQPRVATVVAAGSGTAKTITRQEFLAALARHDDAAQAVMRAVAGKLRWATRRRQEFGGCPVSTRVARVLGELTRVYGRPCEAGVSIGVSLTQPELAALVGASEPSVHRVLRMLREHRIIETGYRRILVRDVPELSRIAGTD